MKFEMEQSGNGKSKQTPSASPSASTTSATSTTTNGSGAGPSVVQQNGSKSHRSKLSSASASSSSLPTSSSTGSWSHFRFANTLPLRILVFKDLVGAIIGRGGGTIRQITQDTHARVDVHRKESSTANENVIMIYGNPESCSQACRRILEVMQQEAKSLNRPDDIVLKMLASNNLIGRIIGKGGNTIKRIMQQTDTKIAVSSANFAANYNIERIIMISGTLDNMCKAEVMVSQKLRQCYESDAIQYQQSLVYSGYHSPVPPLMPPQSGLGMPPSFGATGPHPQPAPLSSYSLAPPMPPSMGPPRGHSVHTGSHSASTSSSSSTGPTSQPSHHLHSVPPTAPPQPSQPPSFYSSYNMPFMPYAPPGPGPSGMSPAYGPTPTVSPYINLNYVHPMQPMDSTKETVTIFIPNTVVGAIIGRGGCTIREMMQFSGASIKVAQLSEDESGSGNVTSSDTGKQQRSSSPQPPTERRVTIVGLPYAQYQAQFFVFQKVHGELSNQMASNASPLAYGDPSYLKVELLVPTNQVRRIIGKNGSVIQDLQRSSGASIKLSKDTQPSTAHSPAATSSTSTTPEVPDSGSANGTLAGGSATEPASDKAPLASSTSSSTSDDTTPVHIVGDFFQSWTAQRQIRYIVLRATSSVPLSQSQATPPPSTSTASSAKSGSGQATKSQESELSKSSTSTSSSATATTTTSNTTALSKSSVTSQPATSTTSSS